MTNAPSAPTCTTCPYCGVGCGVVASPQADGSVTIKGDAAHPANDGRLCVKGTLLGDTVGLDGRLLHPMRGNGERLSWDAAINEVADKFAEAIRTHGPDSVAFYVSGQILTEDYYVANKLMKGFIGSANIDTNSRLCMASSVAGHKRAFGGDIVPGTYEDWDEADVIVLVGSNLAWCHPVLYQRIAATKKARPNLHVVNIDPRRTATSELADMHLALRPGSDVALFNGLLSWLAAHRITDKAYLEAYCEGTEAALEAAGPLDLDAIAKATGITPEDLAAFYALWAGNEKVVTVYSQGVNQWSTGTDKVNAIINCHLYTGRIGKKGMGPFSVTGQPNAMGGREVGGLANMLAAHMALENPVHRDLTQRFWNAPRMADKGGLKAVDLFDAVASGKIKALWIMATNPVVSLPQADKVRAALGGDCFVVVSDMLAQTDTAQMADLLLPATGWGEKDGTVTNSERMISRQRPFLPAPGEARHDWATLAAVGKALGRALGEDWDDAFSFSTPASVFREHAALSGFENGDTRAFDISAYQAISDAGYASLAPFRWPHAAGGHPLSRFFAKGKFYHEGRKAKLIAVSPRRSDVPLSVRYPLVLNTGRVRDHWHTMTRTAKSARLSRHIGEPYLELHPRDAARFGISEDTLVLVKSAQGRYLGRAWITDRAREGSVFAPMHWNGQTASAARIDALVGPSVDPVSGQPESKRTPVSIEPLPAKWYGFAVTKTEPAPGCAYWAKARTETGWRIEMAGTEAPGDLDAFAAELLGKTGDKTEGLSLIHYEDAARGAHRFALFDGDVPLGALFIARGPVAVERDWLVRAFDDPNAGVQRFQLLAGRAGKDAPDAGPTVCTCFGVGSRTIEGAIAAGANSVDAVGKACQAGTNCGSCRPEIQAMLRKLQKAPGDAAAPDVIAAE
ncbi:MAG: molybdopterin-dependent oxidoreductase [Neomegalonema sp.]|nr:molybdopterin-dependent oxidoreductase [Neomegalonema sp.]